MISRNKKSTQTNKQLKLDKGKLLVENKLTGYNYVIFLHRDNNKIYILTDKPETFNCFLKNEFTIFIPDNNNNKL